MKRCYQPTALEPKWLRGPQHILGASTYMHVNTFFPQHILRASFSHGRDRIRRHYWISPLGTLPGKTATDREIGTACYIQYLTNEKQV